MEKYICKIQPITTFDIRIYYFKNQKSVVKNFFRLWDLAL